MRFLFFFAVALVAFSALAGLVNADVQDETQVVKGFKDALDFPFVADTDDSTLSDLKVELVGVGGHPTRRFIELNVTNTGAVTQTGADSDDWGVVVKDVLGQESSYAYEFHTVQVVGVNAPFNDWKLTDGVYSEFDNATSAFVNKSYQFVVDNWKTTSFYREVWTKTKPSDLVFEPSKTVRVRVWVDGIKWSSHVDIIPKFFGKNLGKFAWANSTATWRVTLNLTVKGNGNATNSLIHLTLNNMTQLNTSYCNSAANMSFYWLTGNGSEDPLFGRTDYGSYVEQFNYGATDNQTTNFTSVWIRVPYLNKSLASTPALRIYCGTNGGTTQYSDTTVFQDETHVTLYERDAGTVIYGYNSATAQANATSTTNGSIPNRNYTAGSQTMYTCDGGTCVHTYFVQTPHVHNASANIQIFQVSSEASQGAAAYFSHDTGSGSAYIFFKTASTFGCETTDGILRDALNTTLNLGTANATAASVACLYNKSMGGAGAQNQTLFVMGTEQGSTNMGNIVGLTGTIRWGAPAGTQVMKGAYHSAIFVKGGQNWQLNEAWVKAVHDTGIASSTQEVAEIVPLWASNSTTPANGTTYTCSLFTALNVSWTNTSALSSLVYTINSANTTQNPHENFSTTVLGAGSYFWNVTACSAGGCNTTDTWEFVIAQETGGVAITLNGSFANLTGGLSEQSDLACVNNLCYASSGNVRTNGTVSQTYNSPLANSSIWPAAGSWNFTCSFSGDANYTSNTTAALIYTAIAPASGGGGGSAPKNPVRSNTPILLSDGRIVSSPETDYLATFRLWLRQESDFGGWLVPNWVIVLLICAVGVTFGTKKKPETNKEELTSLGQASVAFGLFAALAFLV